MTCLVWNLKTSTDTAMKVGRHINGLCNETAVVKWMQHNTSGSRQTDQIKTHNLLQGGYYETGTDQTVHLTGLQLAWVSSNRSRRPKTTVPIRPMEPCVCDQLEIKRKFSTAYHSQIDGQTKMINGMIELYLRSYVNYPQDNWEEWLLMGKFSGNNTDSETTDLSPFVVSLFFVNYSYYRRIQTDLSSAKRSKNIYAWTLVKTLEELQNVLWSKITRAQENQKEMTNKPPVPEPDF